MPFGTRLLARWTEDDEARLRTMIEEGAKIPTIAAALGRTKGATIARKNKLGLHMRRQA
jgi:hypothetical protein